jgi:cyclic-di-GMP-binding protein
MSFSPSWYDTGQHGGLDASAPRSSGKLLQDQGHPERSISQENAKTVSKLTPDKEQGAYAPRSELRVSSKSPYDLQKVQALSRAADLDFAVQFTNYRQS